VKPGEVWSCRENKFDSRPWYYLVLEADEDGVDLVLLDSDGEPMCDPGDLVHMGWCNVRSGLLWEAVT